MPLYKRQFAWMRLDGISSAQALQLRPSVIRSRLAERRISVGSLKSCDNVSYYRTTHDSTTLRFCATATRKFSSRLSVTGLLVFFYQTDLPIRLWSSAPNQKVRYVGRRLWKRSTRHTFNLFKHLCASYVRRYCHPRTPNVLGNRVCAHGLTTSFYHKGTCCIGFSVIF